eukprot:353632-Chlamydomonas_euryale.AAC.5
MADCVVCPQAPPLSPFMPPATVRVTVAPPSCLLLLSGSGPPPLPPRADPRKQDRGDQAAVWALSSSASPRHCAPATVAGRREAPGRCHRRPHDRAAGRRLQPPNWGKRGRGRSARGPAIASRASGKTDG